MFPPVVRLGPLQVAWSSISLVVGLVAGVAWLCWRVKTPEQRWRDALRQVIDTYGPVGLVAVVVGRLVYVLAQGSYFVEHPGEALVVWQGGISAQGAVMGLLLGLTWRFRTWPAWLHAADALTVPVVLLVLAGWVSCGLAGCAYGPLVDVGRQPWLAAFDWPDLYGVFAPRVPVQLVGVAVALLCLLWCLWLARRYSTPGILFSSVLLVLSLADIGLQALRADEVLRVGGLRLGVWGDVVLAVVAVGLGIVARRRGGARRLPSTNGGNE